MRPSLLERCRPATGAYLAAGLAEVAGLAGRIDALPAGAIAGVLPIIVVALLIYYLIAVPASTPKEPAKPAAK